MNSLADLYVYLDNGGERKVAMDYRANYLGFFVARGSDTLLGRFPVLSK